MQIRKLKPEDFDSCLAIYNAVIENEERSGIQTGWLKGVYPTIDVIKAGFEAGDMFVLEDDILTCRSSFNSIENRITACCRINKIQPEFYKKACWKNSAPEDKVMVMHTLAVDPARQGNHYGKLFMDFYENYARKNGCPELRMDTSGTNLRAQTFYKKCGFEVTGEATDNFNGIPDVKLICLEKGID